MSKLVFEGKPLPVGYICDCGRYIDILKSHCWDCLEERPREYQQSAFRVYWARQGNRWVEWNYDKTVGAFVGPERILDLPIDEKDIELHSKFFNHEMQEAANMPLEQLATHIEELEKICFEGKVRLQASRQNQKERVAKLSKAERDKLVSKGEFRIDESDSLIRKRTEKISAADKMLAGFKALGMSDDAIKELMTNVKIDEKGKKSASGYSKPPAPTPKASGVVFNGPSKDTQKTLLEDVSNSVVKGLNELNNPFVENPRPIEDIAAAAVTAAHIAKKVDESLKDPDAIAKVEEIKKEIQEESKPEKPFWEIF